MMDLDNFRSILETTGMDVWVLIDTAVTVASLDHRDELKHRRDGIVERVYAATLDSNRCRNCDVNLCLPNGREIVAPTKKDHNPAPVSAPAPNRVVSAPSAQSTGENDEEDDGLDPYGGLFDDEQKIILEIKEQLEDPYQSEDALVELLQSLADMDITFQALQETDIGRHVNQFRKHSSNDVRRLVKLLVRKWKDKIDEWVKNQPGEQGVSALMDDGDSPQLRNIQNVGSHQVPDFANSPNLRTGSSGSDRNSSEPKPKPKAIPRKQAPLKRAPSQSASPHPSHPQNRESEQKHSKIEAERLASARKRLQESYKEAENAKKQRTIQVMDIHDIPKPKNAFFAKNKGGGSHGRHW